jgi:hypothetical protein
VSDDRLTSDDGRLPVKLLYRKDKVVSLDRLPRADGIDPTIDLELRLICVTSPAEHTTPVHVGDVQALVIMDPLLEHFHPVTSSLEHRPLDTHREHSPTSEEIV